MLAVLAHHAKIAKLLAPSGGVNERDPVSCVKVCWPLLCASDHMLLALVGWQFRCAVGFTAASGCGCGTAPGDSSEERRFHCCQQGAGG